MAKARKPITEATDRNVVVLPAGVLQQDASIIDEQDDHLVLTIRVPKQTILSNHLLLMWLSELASGSF